MKGRFPILFASRIDSILESDNERIRRDFVITLFFGLVLLLKGVLEFIRVTPSPFWGIDFVMAGVLFVSSLWLYLEYQRSFSDDFQRLLVRDQNISESPILKLNLFEPILSLNLLERDKPAAPAPDRVAGRELASVPEVTEPTTRELDPRGKDRIADK